MKTTEEKFDSESLIREIHKTLVKSSRAKLALSQMSHLRAASYDLIAKDAIWFYDNVLRFIKTELNSTYYGKKCKTAAQEELFYDLVKLDTLSFKESFYNALLRKSRHSFFTDFFHTLLAAAFPTNLWQEMIVSAKMVKGCDGYFVTLHFCFSKFVEQRPLLRENKKSYNPLIDTLSVLIGGAKALLANKVSTFYIPSDEEYRQFIQYIR